MYKIQNMVKAWLITLFLMALIGFFNDIVAGTVNETNDVVYSGQVTYTRTNPPSGAGAVNYNALTNYAGWVVISYPFIGTNDTYEVTWAGPWPYDVTINRIWGQCDSGTGTAWIVESASNSTWRTYSMTNGQLSLTTTGGGCAIDDAVISTSNKLGIIYIGGTCTQGLVTVWCSH